MKRYTGISRPRTLPLFAAAAALLLASCTDVILASVQEERKVTGADYFKDAYVTGVERSGTIVVASTQRLYYKSETGAETEAWNTATIASGSEDVVGLAKTGTHFYAALSDGKIYRSALTDGATWEAVATCPTGESLVGLFDAGGQVFASTMTTTGSAYALYDVTAGSFGTALLSGQTEPFVGLVHDGTDYWAATRKKLFSGATTGSLSDVGIATGFDATTHRISALGLFGATVQIATFDTSKTDGTNAELYSGRADATPTVVKSGEAGVQVSAIASAPETASDLLLVIGTAAATSSLPAKGYLEATDSDYGTVRTGGDATALLAGTTTNFDTTLSGKSILGFEYVGTAGSGTLYARTYSEGLWKNEWDGTAWTGWSAE